MTAPDPQWLKQQIAAEDYWFHRIELFPGIDTPGWSDPAHEKLPHFALPESMKGLRVLDIGCAEGFFSFEAERRGAREVVAIDSCPDYVRRFSLCRYAQGSRATAYLCSVYDLSPKTFGTFDLVMFFGVLYHLRHPLLALERIREVCTGRMLLQSATTETAGMEAIPWARFHPSGLQSGPKENPIHDPTVFWMPNLACVKAMVESIGFINVQAAPHPIVSCVIQASAPKITAGMAPDQSKAPWS